MGAPIPLRFKQGDNVYCSPDLIQPLSPRDEAYLISVNVCGNEICYSISKDFSHFLLYRC